MYDINNERVTLLSLSPDGTLTDVVAEAGKTAEAIRQTIGCPAVALISLPGDVQMWVNALGRLDRAEPNLYSAAVFCTLDVDKTGAVALGRIVLASARAQDTVSLDDGTRRFVTGLVLSLGGRTAMRPVPFDGGRAWEWERAGTRFRAESHNGSRFVRLQFRTNARDSVWTVSVERDAHGRSAKLVAEDMFRDTTGGAP